MNREGKCDTSAYRLTTHIYIHIYIVSLYILVSPLPPLFIYLLACRFLWLKCLKSYHDVRTRASRTDGQGFPQWSGAQKEVTHLAPPVVSADLSSIRMKSPREGSGPEGRATSPNVHPEPVDSQ